MKVFTAISLLLFSTTSIFGQKTISTPYFKFKCECVEVENAYNPTNKSHNYSYESSDGKSIYMISVKTSTVDQTGFLLSIKKSGTFKYTDTNFKGYKAIIADMVMNGQFGKHLGFFEKTLGFSVIIGSNTKTSVEGLFKVFSDSFVLL